MVGVNTTSVYPCRSCEIPRAHVRANTEKMRDCHPVARSCDNEVGVAISIRDPYTVVSPTDQKSIHSCTILFAAEVDVPRLKRHIRVI